MAFNFFKDFIYLFDREREGGRVQAGGERETGSLLSKKPIEGLDPRTLRSSSELKADASVTKPPRRLSDGILKVDIRQYILRTINGTVVPLRYLQSGSKKRILSVALQFQLGVLK